MRIVELFAGYGSQALALRNLGIEFTSDISEIDKYAIKAYNQIHGETRNYGDIAKIESLDYYDLWTYSSPCTDFSTAGKQKGIYNADGSLTRSGLLKHVERLLETSVALGNQPKYLLMENVKGLVSKKFKPDFLKWLDKLEELGYNNYWQVLNAKDYGIPQNRERVFVISIRKDVDVKGYIFPQKQKLQLKLKDMLENNVDEKYYLKEEQVKRFMQMGNTNPSGRGINGNVCAGDICSTLTTNKGEGLKIKEISNTIRCGGGGSLDGKHTWDIVIEPLCAASRGRNPDNPSDRTIGSPTEQRIEINYSSCTNTLTSVQKDNYVVEPKILEEKCKNDRNKTIRTLLRILWKEIREKKIWEQIGRFQCVSETEILRQGMYEKSFFKTRETISNIFQRSYNSEKYKFIIIENNFLRDMWLSIKSRRSSQRWGLSEQQFREFTSSLQKLSFEATPKKEKLYYMWKTDESFRLLRETLSEIQEIWQSSNIKPQEGYRIRKLTVRECFRLMGVKDEQFDRLSGISNSQLYKLAGNSIVVNVLEAIFRNLFIETNIEKKGQLDLF